MSTDASVRGTQATMDVCSTSTSATSELNPPADLALQNGDREAMEKMQVVLRAKIQEMEEAEAEEKEMARTAKKAIRAVQKILTGSDTISEKLDLFQQKFIERVYEQLRVEKDNTALQKKLDKVTAERAALSEEVRRLTVMNEKLQDLCRTLQAQNKDVVQDAKDKAAAESQQREELSRKMETAMEDISARLEEHSIESKQCLEENTELRLKLERVGQFCDEMDSNHKEQLARKDTQIAFLRERMKEQADLVEQYADTEAVLQEKCEASEAARDTYAKQLDDAKERIDGFCTSFERSNTAFKQLQDQVDMSNKIQRKMQQESELLRKRSDLVQQKSERCLTENERLHEQVDGMRGKLEQSVSIADHNRVRSQKGALEKLCRVLQAEIKDLRKRLPNVPHAASKRGEASARNKHREEGNPMAVAEEPEVEADLAKMEAEIEQDLQPSISLDPEGLPAESEEASLETVLSLNPQADE